MGAWGPGAYDNEDALDTVELMLLKGFENAKTNANYIALAGVSKEFELPLEEDMAKKFIEIIEEELIKVDLWEKDERKERQKVLTDLLKYCKSNISGNA